MLRWIYNLITPAPPARFTVGSTVVGISIPVASAVKARELRQVRSGVRWNEETRGWVYQLGVDGGWHNEDFLEAASDKFPMRPSKDDFVYEPDLPDAELEQVKAEIRAHFGIGNGKYKDHRVSD